MEDKSYRTLVQNLPDIVYKINAEGHFQYINDAAESLGYSSGELLGRHFSVIIHPDDLPRVQRSVVLEKFRGKKTQEGEAPKLFDERREGSRATKGLVLRMIGKGWTAAGQGSEELVRYCDVLSIGSYAGAENGARIFEGTIGIARDITSLKRTESQIVQTERHYRTLIENSTDIITIIAHDGTILFASPSIKRMLGYEPVDIIGDNIADYLYYGETREVRPFQGLEGLHDGIELLFRSGDGEFRTLESFGKRILDDYGNLVCYVVNSRDVTDRKKAEMELAESENYLRVLLDSVRTGVIVIEEDTQRILSANTYALEMIGAPREQVVGAECRRFLSRSSDSPAGARPPDADSSEGALITAEGTRIPVIRNVARIVNRGRTLLVESFINIEQRKLMEDRVRTSLTEKETLLKEVHHRVKSNMQIITSLLNLQATGIRDEAVVAQFREAQGRVMSMALVHELLYRSVDLERINMGDYIRMLTRELLLSGRSAGGSIDLRMNLEPVFLASERAVPCGLVVNELITNIIKHAFPYGTGQGEGRWASEGGPVIEVNLSAEGDGVVLEISDNGTGLPADVDIDNTPSLGLKLVSMLTAQLHGSIEVDRKAGTRYRLMFGAEKRK